MGDVQQRWNGIINFPDVTRWLKNWADELGHEGYVMVSEAIEEIERAKSRQVLATAAMFPKWEG